MSETTVHHVHTDPDAQLESVKIERNSRGFNFEVKAPTVERALEMLDRLQNELEKREVPARRWLTVEAGVEADGIVCEWIGGEEVQTIPEDLIRDANVRYRYRCTEAEAHLFDHAQIKRRFAEAHTLKIVAEIQREDRVRAAAVAKAQTVADKLRAWGEATGTEITPSLLAKLEALEEEVRHLGGDGGRHEEAMFGG